MLILAVGLLGFFSSADAGYVKGYTRSNGTYVAPYYRSSPRSSGSTYTSPTYTTPTYTTPVYSAPAKISTYPANFVGKACGNARIALDKVCRIGMVNQKTSSFENCSEAWENGVKDIPRSSVAFADKLDRDHDGIACEVSDMYDGNTWMYGIEVTSTSPVQATAIKPAVLPSCTGLINIPQVSEHYRAELDFDKDGFACEDNGDDTPKNTVLLGAGRAGVIYIKVNDMHQLAPVNYYGDGKINIVVANKSLTFVAGETKTTEGWILEAAPFYSSSSQGMLVPLSSLKLASCQVDQTGKNFHVLCPDRSVMNGQIALW